MTDPRHAEAALWVERAADGLSARDARAFDQWSRDVENAAAFNRIRNGRGEIERLAADHDFRVLLSTAEQNPATVAV